MAKRMEINTKNTFKKSASKKINVMRMKSAA